MTTSDYPPIDDLELFEVVSALFPDELSEEAGAEMGDEEEVLLKHFDVDGETFARIVGAVLRLTPVQQSPLTNALYHTLGVRQSLANGRTAFLALAKCSAEEQ